MGFFDKVFFWKKNKELERLDRAFGDMDTMPKDLGMSPNDNMGLPQQRGWGQESEHNYNNPFPQSQPQPSYQPQSFQQSAQQYHSPFTAASPRESIQEVQGSADLQVLSAKLEAIKATLDAINQRLANLERAAYPDQNPRRGPW